MRGRNHFLTAGMCAALLLLSTVGAARSEQAFIKGRDAVAAGDYSQAINLLKTAVRSDSLDAEAWRLLGFSFRMLDSLDAAILAYEKVLEIQPGDYDARLALGNLFAYNGEMEQSLRIYNKILDEDSTDVEARLGIARDFAWLGELAQAESAYRAVLPYSPRNAQILIGLGNVLAWRDRYPEAEGIFNRVLEEDSTVAEAWSGLGDIAYWSDKPFQALDSYRRAALLEPGNVQLRKKVENLQRETEWRHEPDYSYWIEDDNGLITEHERIMLRSEKRVSDKLGIVGKAEAYSSLRDKAWKYRRYVGLDLRFHLSPWLSLRPSVKLDVLSGDADQLGISTRWSGRGSLRWLEGGAQFENMLYEIWSDTRATGGWGEFNAKPLRFLSLTFGGGRWSLSDGNSKSQSLASLRLQVSDSPLLAVILRSRYLDFKDDVYGYWTPHSFRENGAGIQFGWNPFSKVRVGVFGIYSSNSDEGETLWLDGTVELTLSHDYRVSTGFTYFETDSSYRMFQWNLGLSAGGLF